jgi:hypothetical protein
MLLATIDTLDRVLHVYRAVLGGDFTAYRNHAYRVVNLCAAQSLRSSEQLEKVAIAAAFHDLGIWTERDIRLPAALSSTGECAPRSRGQSGMDS